MLNGLGFRVPQGWLIQRVRRKREEVEAEIQRIEAGAATVVDFSTQEEADREALQVELEELVSLEAFVAASADRLIPIEVEYRSDELDTLRALLKLRVSRAVFIQRLRAVLERHSAPAEVSSELSPSGGGLQVIEGDGEGEGLPGHLWEELQWALEAALCSADDFVLLDHFRFRRYCEGWFLESQPGGPIPSEDEWIPL